MTVVERLYFISRTFYNFLIISYPIFRILSDRTLHIFDINRPAGMEPAIKTNRNPFFQQKSLNCDGPSSRMSTHGWEKFENPPLANGPSNKPRINNETTN